MRGSGSGIGRAKPIIDEYDLKILKFLNSRKNSKVGDIVDYLKIAGHHITFHLQKLHKLKQILKEKDGPRIWLSLTPRGRLTLEGLS